MSGRVVVMAMLLLGTLTGCGVAPDAQETAGRAQSLWSSRAPYVGDSSRVAALVSDVGPAPEGSYSISLHTAEPPYALAIELERLDKPFEVTDFSTSATLLLGLVGNLDSVSVTSAGHTYSLDAATASQNLGYDVKVLGRDQRRLTTYLAATSD